MIKLQEVWSVNATIETEVNGKRVEAVVNIGSESKVTSISNGYVYEGEICLASFSSNNAEQVSINYNVVDKMMEAAQVVMATINTLRKSTPTVSVEF